MFVGLALLVTLAAIWCFRHGYILYYGDAQAHLNSSRSLIDSLTPGYDQLGTPWLPMLHLICVPFVGNDWLWSTGLAGTIPVAACFAIAGTALYLAAKSAYGSRAAAFVGIACFALNPNVLYLACIPMTEMVFLAGFAMLLLALLRFRETQRRRFVALGVAVSWAMSLTRFDAWFLIPFAGIAFALFSKRDRWKVLLAFGALASLSPLYWLAHNWWEMGNALDFYNGPYSAAAIQGPRSYPGYHDWPIAFQYYSKAGQLCAGGCLLLLGVAGFICAFKKRTARAAILFLLLTPAFYVWSIHSSKTPIYVPQLYWGSYYNLRYGIAVVFLAAFAAGAIILGIPKKWQKFGLALPLVAAAPWITRPSKENWVCWKESQVNSESRRAWTEAAARFFETNYQAGQRILASSGDVTGIFCKAQIPLRETLNIGNGPAWLATITRPDLVHRELWAMAQAGDPLARALARQKAPVYQVVKVIQVSGAPALQIYRRVERSHD